MNLREYEIRKCQDLLTRTRRTWLAANNSMISASWSQAVRDYYDTEISRLQVKLEKLQKCGLTLRQPMV